MEIIWRRVLQRQEALRALADAGGAAEGAGGASLSMSAAQKELQDAVKVQQQQVC